MDSKMPKRLSPTDRQVSPITRALIGCAGEKVSCKERALLLIRNQKLSTQTVARPCSGDQEHMESKRIKLERSVYKSPSDKLISPIARALDGNNLTMKEKAQLMLRRYQGPHRRHTSGRAMNTPLRPMRSKFAFYVEETGPQSKRAKGANSGVVRSPGVAQSNSFQNQNDENFASVNFTPSALGKRKGKSKLPGSAALTPRPINVENVCE